MAATKNEAEITVEKVLELQQQLVRVENDIATNDLLIGLLQKQKLLNEQITVFWTTVESEMIAANIKSIKGDWGSVTIAERTDWDVDDDVLPAKFYKKVVDKKRITDTFRLEGKAPKGATVKYTKYLTKKIREVR